VAISGLLLGTPGIKNHFNVGAVGRHEEYYMWEVVASFEFRPW